MMKRGGVDVYFIIPLIAAVVGFGIILYFIMQLQLGGYAEDEVCKLSVLGRATSPDISKGGVPLKCTTKKICLTKGGDCSNNFAGEKTENFKISGNGEEAAKQIAKISADAMLDCWRMMGEGKLDLFGGFSESLLLDKKKPVCVICSRIAIDASISKEVLEKVNINSYMENNNVDELGANYISAFTSGGSVNYAKKNIVQDNAFGELKDASGKVVSFNKNPENREMAIVFSQIKSDKYEEILDSIFKYGGTVAGLTFLSPIGGAARYIFLNPYGAGLVAVGTAGYAGYGAYNIWQGQLAAVGHCGDFVTNDEASKGCSLMQGINYNVKDINAVCPQIQGNP